jgi:hypothetical protein
MFNGLRRRSRPAMGLRLVGTRFERPDPKQSNCHDGNSLRIFGNWNFRAVCVATRTVLAMLFVCILRRPRRSQEPAAQYHSPLHRDVTKHQAHRHVLVHKDHLGDGFKTL